MTAPHFPTRAELEALADRWDALAARDEKDDEYEVCVAEGRRACATELRALAKAPADEAWDFPTQAEVDALRRCFERAAGSSGGEGRVRKLLFAWHNAAELGGFDIADLWGLSEDWRDDCVTVIGMIARGPQGWYAERYGLRDEMDALIATFGPKGEEG